MLLFWRGELSSQLWRLEATEHSAGSAKGPSAFVTSFGEAGSQGAVSLALHHCTLSQVLTPFKATIPSDVLTLRPTFQHT